MRGDRNGLENDWFVEVGTLLHLTPLPSLKVCYYRYHVVKLQGS